MSYSLLLESWKQQFQWTMFLDFDFQGMDLLNTNTWWHHDDTKHLAFPWMYMTGTKGWISSTNGTVSSTSTGSTRSTSATVLLYPPNKYIVKTCLTLFHFSLMQVCYQDGNQWGKGCHTCEDVLFVTKVKWCGLCWVVTYNLNLFQGFIFKQSLILIYGSLWFPFSPVSKLDTPVALHQETHQREIHLWHRIISWSHLIKRGHSMLPPLKAENGPLNEEIYRYTVPIELEIMVFSVSILNLWRVCLSGSIFETVMSNVTAK